MKRKLVDREEVLLDGFEAGVNLCLRETNLPLRTFPGIAPIYLMMRSQTIFCAILVKAGKDNYYHFYDAHLLFGDTLSRTR
jgi:hypothetical protein